MAVEPHYLPIVTREHLDAASAAMRKIAALVSSVDHSGERSILRVRVGLVDHGAFLSLDLRSFAMMAVDPEGSLTDVAHSGEVVLAMVANKPISVQITTLLQFLATFLARQRLSSEVRAGASDIGDIDALALTADESATGQVQDDLRVGDWDQAARRIADRARNDGFALEVRFAEPLLDKAEIDLRVPLLRRVYNTQPAIRTAIDRVAGVSQTLHLVGDDVPPEAFRQTQALVDIGSMQRFTAHVMRDAFVCGNGYLAFGQDAGSPMRLLRPEFVRHVGPGKYEEADEKGDFRPVVGHVLHQTGTRQVGSEYGVSVLEPFLQIAATNETLDYVVQDGALNNPPPGWEDEASRWLSKVIDLRERTFSQSAERIAATLGGATSSLRDPDSETLYFPGLARMDGAADTFRSAETMRRNPL